MNAQRATPSCHPRRTVSGTTCWHRGARIRLHDKREFADPNAHAETTVQPLATIRRPRIALIPLGLAGGPGAPWRAGVPCLPDMVPVNRRRCPPSRPGYTFGHSPSDGFTLATHKINTREASAEMMTSETPVRIRHLTRPTLRNWPCFASKAVGHSLGSVSILREGTRPTWISDSPYMRIPHEVGLDRATCRPDLRLHRRQRFAQHNTARHRKAQSNCRRRGTRRLGRDSWPKEYGRARRNYSMRSHLRRGVFRAPRPVLFFVHGRAALNLSHSQQSLMSLGQRRAKRGHLRAALAPTNWWVFVAFSEPEALGRYSRAWHTSCGRPCNHFRPSNVTRRCGHSGAPFANYTCFYWVRTDPQSPKHHSNHYLLVDMTTPVSRCVPGAVNGPHFHDVVFVDVRSKPALRPLNRGGGAGRRNHDPDFFERSEPAARPNAVTESPAVELAKH